MYKWGGTNCTYIAYNDILKSKLSENGRNDEFLSEWDLAWMALKNQTLKSNFIEDEVLVSGQIIVDAMFTAANMAIEEQ